MESFFLLLPLSLFHSHNPQTAVVGEPVSILEQAGAQACFYVFDYFLLHIIGKINEHARAKHGEPVAQAMLALL